MNATMKSITPIHLAATMLVVLAALLRTSLGAPFVKSNAFAKVIVDDQSGKFQIFEVSPLSTPLTYPGKFSSHTNFLMNVSGTQQVFTNEIDGSYSIPGATVHRADSIYYQGDSIIAQYDLFGVRIRQYTYAFLTSGSGQIAIEYRVVQVDTNSANRLLGILLEMDLFAADPQAVCPGSGNDRSLILDSHGYEAKPVTGSLQCWTGTTAKYTGDTVPVWFHCARLFPSYDCNGCAIATGTLSGPSRVASSPATDTPAAPVLTPPSEFYVGDWGDTPTLGLKNVAWNVASPNFVTPGTYTDCAVIYKWNVSQTPFRCCTAYGPNDGANDNLLCPQQAGFVDMRFPSTLFTDLKTGKAVPRIDTIRVWAANTQHSGAAAHNMTCTLDQQPGIVLASGESLVKNMTLVGGSSNDIPAGRSGYCEYLLQQDSIGYFYFSVHLTTTEFPGAPDTCPVAFIVSPLKLTADANAPTMSTSSEGAATHVWRAFDSGKDDSGIDSVQIVDQSNMAVTVSSFTRCTKQPVVISSHRVDSTHAGCVAVRLVDCAGNDTTIGRCYSTHDSSLSNRPRAIVTLVRETIANPASADTFPPTLVGSYLCGVWDCMARTALYLPLKPRHLVSLAFVTDSSFNLRFSVPPLTPLDTSIEFIVTVIEPALPASGLVVVRDEFGNEREYRFTYSGSDVSPSGDTAYLRTPGPAPETFDTCMIFVNTGQQVCNINAFDIVGPGAAAYSFILPLRVPVTIQPFGGTYQLCIRKQSRPGSDSAGCDDAMLRAVSADNCVPGAIVYLRGCNHSAHATVTHWNSTMTRTVVGGSVGGTVSIASDGTDTVVVRGLVIGGPDSMEFSVDLASSSPFQTDPATVAWTLAPGAQERLGLRFTPTSTGAKTAQLRLITNVDPTGGTAAELSGIGLSPNDVGDVVPALHELSLRSYPTPALSDVTVQLTGHLANMRSPVTIQFNDLLGRTQAETHGMLDAAGSMRVALAPLALHTGTWLLRVEAEGRILSSRMVILR